MIISLVNTGWAKAVGSALFQKVISKITICTAENQAIPMSKLLFVFFLWKPTRGINQLHRH